MRRNGYQLEDGLFGMVRNESKESKEDDELIDKSYFDAQAISINANMAKRRIKRVVDDLVVINAAVTQMLKFAEDPLVDKENFKKYVDDPGKELVELVFETVVRIKGITRLLPTLELCEAMGINTRKGTFYVNDRSTGTEAK